MVVNAATTISLSTNDARVFNALFDPESLPASEAASKDQATIDPNLPSLPYIPTPLLSKLEAQQTAIVKRVEADTSITTINTAMAELSSIIRDYPTYPSAYLNRAMLCRIYGEVTAPNCVLADQPDRCLTLLFYDLSRAIHLASPESLTVPVSEYQARVLRTAYAHRAYLYLKASEQGESLGGKGREELEELASADFGGASRFGDEVAREMGVRTNPWRKACGEIVREAMREERGG